MRGALTHDGSQSDSSSSSSSDDDDVVVAVALKNDCRIKTRAAIRPGPGVTDSLRCRTVVVGVDGDDLDEDPAGTAARVTAAAAAVMMMLLLLLLTKMTLEARPEQL